MKERYLFDSGSKAIAIITALFSLPILLSGILYQDDILRSANGEAYWGALGRPLSDVVVMGLGFGSDFVVNLFPLTLILATTLLAASSIILYNRFAIKRDITTGIAFSLFSLSPFFLQNLSYQFDSFPMMLGVFFSVLPYSILVQKVGLVSRVFLSAIMIIASLCLYQATVNIFIAICAIEIIFNIRSTGSGIVAAKAVINRGLSLILALIIYLKIIVPIYVAKSVNSDLIFKASNPIESLRNNINRFAAIVESLNNTAFIYAWAIALFVATIAIFSISLKIIKNNESLKSKIISIILIMSSILVSIFSVAGPFLFIDKTVVAPRVMMGMPGLMLLVGYLCTLIDKKIISIVACIIPVTLSLSLSSAYANASKSQRALEDKVFYQIASEIPKSWFKSKMYITGQVSTSQATSMEFKRFPVLKWMITPLYSWSGMIMLKHYNIPVEMANNVNITSNNSKIIFESRYITLSEGERNIITLK
ncbi:glucosyltransferase domain-containing protein [Yersinia sp. Marseille-Q5920]|uniref:glucosyltransferase domain-containing protein n=2 Tax=Yersinia TaxID=629 RepID=UPI002264FDDE|nr:glucosyltransferase domain-containing protein [Yersinia sp. Marseille-Q5920]